MTLEIVVLTAAAVLAVVAIIAARVALRESRTVAEAKSDLVRERLLGPSGGTSAPEQRLAAAPDESPLPPPESEYQPRRKAPEPLVSESAVQASPAEPARRKRWFRAPRRGSAPTESEPTEQALEVQEQLAFAADSAERSVSLVETEHAEDSESAESLDTEDRPEPAESLLVDPDAVITVATAEGSDESEYGVDLPALLDESDDVTADVQIEESDYIVIEAAEDPSAGESVVVAGARIVGGRVFVPPTQEQAVAAMLSRPAIRISIVVAGVTHALRPESRDRILGVMRREFKARKRARHRAARAAARSTNERPKSSDDWISS